MSCLGSALACSFLPAALKPSICRCGCGTYSKAYFNSGPFVLEPHLSATSLRLHRDHCARDAGGPLWVDAVEEVAGAVSTRKNRIPGPGSAQKWCRAFDNRPVS